MNALRHGLLSKNPVIPGESVEEYRAHYEGLKQSYRPVGYLENLRVKRIAGYEWKLMEIDQYELGLIANQFEEIESLGVTVTPEELAGDQLEWVNTSPSMAIEVLTALFDGHPDLTIAVAAVAAIVAALKRTVRRAAFQKEEIAELMRGSMDMRNGWTVGALRRVLELISSPTEGTVEEITDRCIVLLQIPSIWEHDRLLREELLRTQKFRAAIIPSDKDRALTMRYRRSTEGSRDREIKLLEIDQRARSGTLPAPIRIALEED
jgi:hypothetical protein